MTTKQRSRHGMRRVMVAVKLAGMDAIDRRTAAARAVIGWREKLLAALGGPENVSPQKAALVEMAARTRALIDHADAYLLAQGSIINRRKRAFVPLVSQRQTLCDSLARLLSQLGLERVPRHVESLTEYISSRTESPS